VGHYQSIRLAKLLLPVHSIWLEIEYNKSLLTVYSPKATAIQSNIIVRLIMCTVLNVMAWSMKIAVAWVLEKIAQRKRTGKYNIPLKALPLFLRMKNTILGWGVLRQYITLDIMITDSSTHTQHQVTTTALSFVLFTSVVLHYVRGHVLITM